MKKNAFTLIELLTVIILLAVIATIVFPMIQDSINNSKEKTYKENKEQIIDATKRWSTDYNSTLTTTNGAITYKTIACLKEKGYLAINKDIKNPVTGTLMTGCVKITYDAANKQYKYEYQDSCGGTDACTEMLDS